MSWNFGEKKSRTFEEVWGTLHSVTGCIVCIIAGCVSAVNECLSHTDCDISSLHEAQFCLSVCDVSRHDIHQLVVGVFLEGVRFGTESDLLCFRGGPKIRASLNFF